MLNLLQNTHKKKNYKTKKRIHFALLPYIFYYCVKIMREEETVRMARMVAIPNMSKYIRRDA